MQDLNRGQKLGIGPARKAFPGLTQRIDFKTIQAKNATAVQQLPEKSYE